MTGFALFGGMLAALLIIIIRAAVRAGEDTGAALGPEERRDAAIEALRELELERRTGKVTPEEYGAVRARLEQIAIQARDEARAEARGETRSEGRGEARGGAPVASAAPAEAPLSGGEMFCPACGISIQATC